MVRSACVAYLKNIHERQVFEILKRCLIVDPDVRYTAEMLAASFS
ncbi:unnamed protein product [Brugia timori]|uniref:Adaptin_N domain-containing protein n=1 Tax=Brugia timori TaxID=42155 RepID=A0A0R3R943_9BILA|nr:unnamed protein product [Brugia timori]